MITIFHWDDKMTLVWSLMPESLLPAYYKLFMRINKTHYRTQTLIKFIQWQYPHRSNLILKASDRQLFWLDKSILSSFPWQRYQRSVVAEITHSDITHCTFCPRSPPRSMLCECLNRTNANLSERRPYRWQKAQENLETNIECSPSWVARLQIPQGESVRLVISSGK